MGNKPTPAIAKRSAPTFTKVPFQQGTPVVVGPSEDPDAKKVRIIVLSDTHRMHRKLGKLPDGDILVHCGDWSNWATAAADTADFNDWLKEQPHALKIVVAGNHETNLSSGSPMGNRAIITNAVYLQGEEFVVNGIKFWGGPWNPARGFTKRANGFSISPRQSAQNWSKMPDDVDILITHCPPYGVLDRKEKNQNVTYMGCPQLLDHVIRVSPMLHMFGHCHYESGVAKAVIDHRDVFASRLQHKKSLTLDTRKEAQNNRGATSRDVNFNESIEQNVEASTMNSTKPPVTAKEQPTEAVNEMNAFQTNSDAGLPWICKKCTFRNEDESFLTCAVCGGERSFEVKNVNSNIVFINAANKFRMYPTVIDVYKVLKDN